MPTQRCVIYARISVSQDTSVAIESQIESAEQYAASQGWQVVGIFRDEGVSATHNKPEDRPGWRALLSSTERYDAVIVWKTDRLARRVLDFLHADETLQKRKAGLVAVKDPIDMTTSQGRAFATMLAVFAQMEAEAISDRVKKARSYLIKSGRVVGGTVPYGWRSAQNPGGKGLVLAQDLDRIRYVRGMVDRVLRGDSIYSTVQWLDEVGAPLPGASQKHRKAEGWAYSTVERLLRNPVLAGMTAFNPGNESKARGTELLRGEDGLPVVDESVAIMSAAEWRAMVKALNERDSAQSMPRAMRSKTSPLLSGLVYCGEHLGHDGGVRMHRGTAQGRPGYSCPVCHQTITNFEDQVVAEFLRMKGERVRWSVVEEIHEGGAAMLPEIEHRLDELDGLIRQATDRTTRQRLQIEQGNLLDLRDEKRAEAPTVTQRWVGETQMFGEDWAEADTVEDKRAILGDAIERVWVRRGRPGRRTVGSVLARLRFDWKVPEDLGPLDETL